MATVSTRHGRFVPSTIENAAGPLGPAVGSDASTAPACVPVDPPLLTENRSSCSGGELTVRSP